MSSAKGLRQVGYLDCPGGGQIVVAGTTAFIGHMRAPAGTSIVCPSAWRVNCSWPCSSSTRVVWGAIDDEKRVSWTRISACGVASTIGCPFGWRGNGTGRFPDANPPTVWSETKNVRWSTVVGSSYSSPVLTDKLLFVTSEPNLLLCVNRADGKLRWKLPIKPGDLREENSRKAAGEYEPPKDGSGLMAATPLTDGKTVYLAIANGIVAAVDLEGYKVLLADMAGVRETEHEIEAEGVRRARAWAQSAALRLWVVDAADEGESWREAADLVRSGDGPRHAATDRHAHRGSRSAPRSANRDVPPQPFPRAAEFPSQRPSANRSAPARCRAAPGRGHESTPDAGRWAPR